MADKDELLSFLQDFNENEALDDHSNDAEETQGPSLEPAKNLQLLKEALHVVLKRMKSGYCSSCPESQQVLEKCRSSEEQLCDALLPLLSLIHQKSSNRSICERKSWTSFHNETIKGFPAVIEIIGCKQSANLLALEVYEQLINKLFPKTAMPMANFLEPLSEKDHDILSYIGGSIVSKLRKRYRSKRLEKHEQCLRSLGAKRCYAGPNVQQSLTEVLDRGGLTYLTPTALPIFTSLEQTMREFYAENLEKLLFAEYKAKVSDLVAFTFLELTCEYAVEDEVKSQILDDVVKLFFKIRCYSRLQKVVRKLKAKKHVPQKQKSLRKTLKKTQSTP